MLREHPAELADLIGQSATVRTRVDVWLDGELAAESVPLLAGELLANGDQQVPEAVTLSVPARDDTGREWVPADPTSPLSQHGQRLRLTYLLGRADGTELAVGLGWFPITSWESNGWTVELEAAGLGHALDEWKLYTPTSPPTSATFQSEARRLVEGTMPVEFSPALANRAVPTSLAWQDDRLAALHQLADAWPARLYVDSDGVLTFAEPHDDEADPADITLAAIGDVVVRASSGGTREGVYSVVVARGEDSTSAGRPPVYAVVQELDSAAPTYVERYGRVVRFFSSPLLTTAAQCQAAGRTMLDESRRAASTIPVELLPDPRITIGTRVDYLNADGELVRARVESYRLPLTAQGGAMAAELAVLP